MMALLHPVWRQALFYGPETFPFLVLYAEAISHILALGQVRAAPALPCPSARPPDNVTLRVQYLQAGVAYDNGVVRVEVSLPTAEDIAAAKRPANRPVEAVMVVMLSRSRARIVRLWCNHVGASRSAVFSAPRLPVSHPPLQSAWLRQRRPALRSPAPTRWTSATRPCRRKQTLTWTT